QQGLRPYYQFPDVDVDRYRLSTGYQQVMLAARELNTDQLPQKTWVAQRLQYTHGYGVVVSPVDAVTQEGSAEYLVKDMPPQPIPQVKKELTITQPQIYHGTAENGYAIVGTDQPEFDYPAGGEDRTVLYEGKRGVSIGSYGRKLLYSLRFGDPNIVLSNLIGSRAQVLFHRQIDDRIGTLAPFLLRDQDPYLVIADGKLYWIVDCYTVTDRYPYSQPIGGINYIRNSVKVVVDAYDGTTSFYVFNKQDPVIRSYQKIFPDLFLPQEKFPASLLPHIRYPEDLFNVQSRLYRRYHMKDPRTFYTQSDAWDLATASQPDAAGQGQEAEPMEPYYVTMRLPGSNALDFVLIRPFTPVGKLNLSAWMAVRCDPANYGRMLVYEFPKTSLTQGPAQIEARIHQDPEISQRVSLWDTRGSQVLWGPLLVFPMGRAMLYVQPLYLQSEQGSRMPELKQVVVSTDQPQRVVMAPTLDAALSQLVGETMNVKGESPAVGAGMPTGGTRQPGNNATLIRRANQLLQQAETAQRAGNWSEYGQALNQLRQTLRQLNTPAPNVSPAPGAQPRPPAPP
ncbi:MAG: UPF0182 family protein, partial [Armatimonadetes bacterium]|nr:UPF0182 family protein [Armatimonadota bacterium]